MRRLASALAMCVTLAIAPHARADGDDGVMYLPPAPHQIVVEEPGERTTKNAVVIGGIAAVGVVLGAIGLAYNLDASSNANAVSQSGPSGMTWSTADQAHVDAASRDSIGAAVFYSIGGAFAIAAAVAFIVTDPPSKKVVMQTGHRASVVPVVAPAPGGATAGAIWRF
jgi:hypothetical protein